MNQLKSMNPNNEGDVQAALDAGRALGVCDLEPRKIGADGIPHLVSDNPVTLTSIEKMLGTPARVRATVACETPEGFVEYVKRYRTVDTAIFLRREQGDLTAVIDYHRAEALVDRSASRPTVEPGQEVILDGVDQARAAEHRAFVKATETPEWKRWKAINKQAMSQGDLARFLEDNLQDVAEPSGATLYEIARKFQVKKDVAFQSSVNLTSGEVQLRYHEDIAAGGSSAGEITVPEKFVLGIAPYYGNQLFKVEVRFRYRLQDGGKLVVWIDIVRLEDLLLQAFDEIVKAIKAAIGTDNAPVYIEGTAPTTKDIWGS